MTNLTHDDIMELQNFFDDRYDGRYVKQDYCDTQQHKINNKFANDDKRIDILILEQKQNNRQQKINNWLTTAIAAGIITLVIKVFLGG